MIKALAFTLACHRYSRKVPGYFTLRNAADVYNHHTADYYSADTMPAFTEKCRNILVFLRVDHAD